MLVFCRVMWSHSAWGGVQPLRTGEGTGTMSNTSSREYRIMHRHLASPCVPVFVSQSQRSEFPWNPAQLRRYVMIQWCRVWHNGFLSIKLLQYTSHFVIYNTLLCMMLCSSTPWHSAQCGGSMARQWWLFKLCREGGFLRVKRKSCGQQRFSQAGKAPLCSRHVGLTAQQRSEMQPSQGRSDRHVSKRVKYLNYGWMCTKLSWHYFIQYH